MHSLLGTSHVRKKILFYKTDMINVGSFIHTISHIHHVHKEK